MKILVIDDESHNQASARETLKGHDVVVCATIKQAYDELNKEDAAFDAVLTDLFMPVGDFRGAMSGSGKESPVPAGLVFALKALDLGIRTVLLTDADHHQDRICSLLDLVGNTPRNKRVAYIEARTACMRAVWNAKTRTIVPDEEYYSKGSPRIKDWNKAMKYSNLFPEIKNDQDS